MLKSSVLMFFLLLSFCMVSNVAGEPQTTALPVYFYFIPGCPKCKQAKAAVAAAEKRFGSRVRVVRFDLAKNQNAFNTYINILNKLRIRTTPNLLVVMGTNDYLDSEDKIIDLIIPNLTKILNRKENSPGNQNNRKEQSAKSVITKQVAEKTAEHIDRTDLLMLSFAALTDGFNPCAFATVILFVSMLAAVGRSGKEVMSVGVSFLVAVFLTYFIIGLSFFKVMAMMKNLQFFSQIISWAALTMVSIAGALSLLDGIRAMRNAGQAKMILVLPNFLKNRIRRQLTRSAHSRGLVISAFLAGIAVSFLESACTGQVYFPLIMGLVNGGTRITHGILLLLWYNILFLLPLIAVFTLALFGVSNQVIAGFSRRHAWVTKFALAIVFFSMAAWLAIKI